MVQLEAAVGSDWDLEAAEWGWKVKVVESRWSGMGKEGQMVVEPLVGLVHAVEGGWDMKVVGIVWLVKSRIPQCVLTVFCCPLCLACSEQTCFRQAFVTAEAELVNFFGCYFLLVNRTTRTWPP